MAMDGCVLPVIEKGMVFLIIRRVVQDGGYNRSFYNQHLLCLLVKVLRAAPRCLLLLLFIACLLMMASPFKLAVASNATTNAHGITELSYQAGLVDLRAQDADLKDLLKQLAEITGVEITATDLESGPVIKVSATITKSPVDKAVKQILANLPASGIMSIGNDKAESGSGEIERIYVITRGGEIGGLYSPVMELSDQEEEKIRFNNHREILAAQNIIRKYRREQRHDETGYSQSELQRWIVILYKDALMWRLLEQNISLGERELIIEMLNNDAPSIVSDLIVGPSPHLSERYLEILEKLIVEDFNSITSSTSNKGIGRRLSTLINKRKQHSDVYFETKLKRELMSEDYTLDDRIQICSGYLHPEDISMLRMVREYFIYYLDEKDVSVQDSKKIQKILRKINNVD